MPCHRRIMSHSIKVSRTGCVLNRWGCRVANNSVNNPVNVFLSYAAVAILVVTFLGGFGVTMYDVLNNFAINPFAFAIATDGISFALAKLHLNAVAVAANGNGNGGNHGLVS